MPDGEFLKLLGYKTDDKNVSFFFKSTDQSERFLAWLRDKKPAMHYSMWFNVIRDGAEVAESFKDACVLKGFAWRRERGKKKANSLRCASVSEQSEWVKGSGVEVGMNNAGQGPIVWRDARCSSGLSTGDFVKYWFTTLKLLCECCPACWRFFYFLHRILRTRSQRVR